MCLRLVSVKYDITLHFPESWWNFKYQLPTEITEICFCPMIFGNTFSPTKIRHILRISFTFLNCQTWGTLFYRPRLSHAMHQVRQHWHRFDACALKRTIGETVHGKNLCGLIISDKNFLAGGLGSILRFPGRVISIVHVFLRKNAMWVGSVRYINM